MKYVNQEALIEQHKKQEKNKATGIDNVSKTEYDENLKKNTAELIDRMKSMSYKPQEVKRVYIPKTGSNELRPLGIPAYEDRLVQGVMADVLNEIYEHIFLDCSFGFRPGRDCHQAIKKLDEIIMKKNINYGVSDNMKRMTQFRRYVIHELYQQICRRSQKGKISWEKYSKILEYNPISVPKIYHSMWQ